MARRQRHNFDHPRVEPTGAVTADDDRFSWLRILAPATASDLAFFLFAGVVRVPTAAEEQEDAAAYERDRERSGGDVLGDRGPCPNPSIVANLDDPLRLAYLLGSLLDMPVADASVGVAMPRKMVPSTRKISSSGGISTKVTRSAMRESRFRLNRAVTPWQSS